MNFDYHKEAERIWGMSEEDFIEEYNATAGTLCNGPVNIKCLELLEIKIHHTMPKYYVKLKDILFNMVFNELLDRNPKNAEALPTGLILLKKLRAYILQLNRLQMPPYPESFRIKLNFIDEKITLFEKMI